MKPLLKATLLSIAMTSLLNVPLAQAATAEKSTTADTSSTTKANTTKANSSSTKKSIFKNDDQQAAYALGASLGRYMENSLQAQNKLGIKLDKQQVMAGLHDAMANKSKLSDDEITNTLNDFETRVKTAAQQKMEAESIENQEKGDEFRIQFAQKADVKKTTSGLLYRIEKQGSGESPKENDSVVVHYSGKLINGDEFDSSYKRNEPLTFRLNSVIPGWTEGLQLIKKGGKIELVVPPALAYGKRGIPGIPPNSTLVFDVELLDIKTPDNATKEAEAVTSSADASMDNVSDNNSTKTGDKK